MDEERTGVEKLMTVKLLPLIGLAPGAIALLRVSGYVGEAEAEDVKNERFVVSLPTILYESAFRSPPMSYGDSAILRPLPVCSSVDRVGDFTKLAFVVRVAIEILRGRQCSCDQEGRIDC